MDMWDARQEIEFFNLRYEPQNEVSIIPFFVSFFHQPLVNYGVLSIAKKNYENIQLLSVFLVNVFKWKFIKTYSLDILKS
jgi:hypothetical protein